MLEQMMQTRKASERDPHVPPEHIVTGNCTFEAFNRYIALHPFETIRAKEAVQMYEWLYPFIKHQMAEQIRWGLLDIIGEKPGDTPDDKGAK